MTGIHRIVMDLDMELGPTGVVEWYVSSEVHPLLDRIGPSADIPSGEPSSVHQVPWWRR